MATKLAEKPVAGAPVEPETDPPAEKPPGGMKLNARKLKVIVLLLAVMGVQMTVGYTLLPEPAVSHVPDADAIADAAGANSPDQRVDTVEVPLGSFNPTNSRGPAGSVMHVSFELTAIVASNNAQSLKTAIGNTHGARVRAAVVRVIRSSNLEDLNDPDFNVIKRKIREEINNVLQQTWVNEVVLDRIRLMPQ